MQGTPAAVLRAILGIKDAEMAEILGCSRATIHSLESGRLKMSNAMARRMFHETHISPQWALAGNAKAPPVAAGGEPYTRAIFERAQAEKVQRNRPPLQSLLLDALGYAARLVAILTSASNRGEYYMASYKTWAALRALREEFGQDLAVYTPTNSSLDQNAEQALAVLQKFREAYDEAQVHLSRLFVQPTPAAAKNKLPRVRKKRKGN
jgi:DNA-binding XRE family transcriptional regulator